MKLTALRSAVLIVILMLVLATVCAAQPYFMFEPPQGFFNGGTLYYLLTDVSSSALATQFTNNGVASPAGINVTPKLTKISAVNIPVLYYVSNGVGGQALIFGAQWPSNTYLPIWKVVKVKWLVTANKRILLKSILDVQKQGTKIQLTSNGEVAAASILITTTRSMIPQAQAVVLSGNINLILPLAEQYVNGNTVTALMLDFGYQSEATQFGGNYAPAMNTLNTIRNRSLPEPWRKLYARFTQLWPNQLPIGTVLPGDTGYSPLVNEWQVKVTTQPAPGTTPITNVVDIPNNWPKTALNFMGYEPIVEPFP